MNAKVKFSIKKAFSVVNGEFQKVNYNIDLYGSISGFADISSVESNSELRDKHLQNPEWFDSKNFPQIIVKSEKITKKSDKNYIGDFSITIKGKTLRQEIPFTISHQNGMKILKAEFPISLKNFNIGGGFISIIVGKTANISIELPF